MDKSAAVLAAFTAGKLPTTAQFAAAADWLLNSPLIQLEQAADSAGGALSEQGSVIVGDLRELVEAYKSIAQDKNGDDQLQDALYNLAQGEVEVTDEAEEGANEAASDAAKFSKALGQLLKIVISHFGTESGHVLGELASFARGSLADVAEAVEKGAAATKDKLRQTEDEVQEGSRDALGRKRKREDGEEDGEETREKFKRRMDAAKEVGSQAIGAAQEIGKTTKEVTDKAGDRLNQALWKVCERAQGDDEYHSCIATLFSLAEKWLDRSLDKASEMAVDDTPAADLLSSLVEDPTGRIPAALASLRTIAERFAGDTSLDDLLSAAAACAADIREDDAVRGWCEDWSGYARKCLDEPGFLLSDECTEAYEELAGKYEEIMSADTDEAKKWSEDVDKFWETCGDFMKGVTEDGSLERLRAAHGKLAGHVAAAGPTAVQVAAGQAAWVWKDLLDVVLPRVFALVKEIPLPRTEYVDDEVEFVLEHLDLQSLALLPGSAHISQTTDVDISRESSASAATSDVRTRTSVRLTGVQLALKDVSFYYKDKTSALGEHTGLLDVTLPPKGIDITIELRLLSTADVAEREKRQSFCSVDTVSVVLSPDITLNIRESNHPVLLALLQPTGLLHTTFATSLTTALEGYLRTALEAADHLAWDVYRRAGVFSDAGAPSVAAYLSAIVSEIGHLGKESAGAAGGLRATGVGLVREGENGAGTFAIGATPQILPGEKHGPAVAGSLTALRGDGAKVRAMVEGKDAAGKAGELAGEVGGKVGEAVSEGVSFVKSVEGKVEEESGREGWRSGAFDF